MFSSNEFKFNTFYAKMYVFDEDSVYLNDIDKDIRESFIIFPSKHQSKANIPSFTMHATGNWGKAEVGGKDHTLSCSWVDFLINSFRILKKKVKKLNINIDVTPEVTHHGPLVNKPHAYIEIGSSLNEWKNELYGRIIAETIIETLNIIFSSDYKRNFKVAFGIGGTHYCSNFISIYDRIGFSHICPKYGIMFLDEELILQAINKSLPKAEFVILDWKGINEKERIIKLLNKLNIKYYKLKEIKKFL